MKTTQWFKLLAVVTLIAAVLGSPVFVASSSVWDGNIPVKGNHPVEANWSCSGDIKIEGVAMYDNDTSTRLVVFFVVGSSDVYAEWGARCEKVSADQMMAKVGATYKRDWNGKTTNPPSEPTPAPQQPQNPAPQPAPTPAIDSSPYTFPQTGKTVSGPYRVHWTKHGGLAVFGYPISDPMDMRSKLDGKVYQVQYFERAVFELHPEYKGTDSEILGRLLGREAMYEEVGNPNCPGDRELHAGETMTVKKGCTVKGEVKMKDANGNWVVLYDNNPATGFLVTFTEETVITTDFGVNVSPRGWCNLQAELESTGCGGNGCMIVTHVLWPHK